MIGIYKITNLLNDDCYIGSSINIERRWKQHIYRYDKQGGHYDYYIYKAFRKYGVENFGFKILEECEKQFLIKREQYYYELLNPKYNLLVPKDNPSLNEEVRKKIGEKSKEMWKTRTIDIETKKQMLENLSKTTNKYIPKKIKAININTNEITIFESMYKAEKTLNIARSSISQILNVNHYKKTAKGFKFEFCD